MAVEDKLLSRKQASALLDALAMCKTGNMKMAEIIGRLRALDFDVRNEPDVHELLARSTKTFK